LDAYLRCIFDKNEKVFLLEAGWTDKIFTDGNRGYFKKVSGLDEQMATIEQIISKVILFL
jgi:hypothetical protein